MGRNRPAAAHLGQPLGRAVQPAGRLRHRHGTPDGLQHLALVPLGTPMLAGPGAIVTIMLFARKVETLSSGVALALAVVAAHVIIGLTLMYATRIVSLIKEAGVMLLAKIAGLLTAAIAFQMLMTGIKDLIA